MDSARPRPPGGVERAPFGTLPDGREVERFTLRNAHGVDVSAITYGGIITSLRVPDRDGLLDDVVLGFDALEPYVANTPYFGAIVGRYCNRIARGCFRLDGKTHELACNNGGNHLHGGRIGFDKVLWTAEPFLADGAVGVVLSHTSPAGEEGYPGNLSVRVTYTLTDTDALVLDYLATTDAATPVNLTQHSYFNLAGEGSGVVLDHELCVAASRYTPLDAGMIPTGELAPVQGTPFDFRTPTTIGARIEADDPQIARCGGYDCNLVLDAAGQGGARASALLTGRLLPGTDLAFAARLTEPTTGRMVEAYTREPALQLYVGNGLDGTLVGKSGRAYLPHGGLCLETQHFPDSPNHPDFPSTILRPGETYRTRTVYAFGVAGGG